MQTEYSRTRRAGVCSMLLLLGMTALLPGQEIPPPVTKPLLRLEAGGPTSNVTSLAFSPDGDTLYAAGFDKVVRVWGRNPKSGLFEFDEKRYFRVPINPGTEGAINAMALSADGEWLAVGGRGVVRVAAGFFNAAGRVWPVVGMTPEARSDQGLIYVFATRRQEVRTLRGHSGEILSLAFAPARPGQPPLLVSAANGWDAPASKVTGEVRVWDVLKETSLGAWLNLPPPVEGGLPPGLGAVFTGPQSNQLRVLVAWGDAHQGTDQTKRGYLRLLDLNGPQGQVQTLEDGYHNTALASFADDKTLLSGSFLKNKAQLQTWDLTVKPLVVKQQVALPAPDKSFYFPDRLGLFAATDKGPLDHVAVLIRQLTKVEGKDGAAAWTEENRLHVMDLAGQTKVAVPLWRNTPVGAVLATTPGGRHIAVAGHLDHAIRVYAIADLLRNKIEPQVLHSVGATMRRVAFATRPDKDQTRLGLVMHETSGAAQEGGLVFDFKERALTDKVQGWTSARPDPGDWQIERIAKTKLKDREVIIVRKRDQPIKRLALPDDQWVTSMSLLPLKPPVNEPFLVVASYIVEKGLPLLEVYQARTGKLVRWYSGHTAPITALALSPDGKLLASAANDQTVAVWSLADLNEILNRQGRLAGVVVDKRGQDLVVVRVEEDGPGELAPGTVIEAIVVKGKEVRPTSGLDFYETFWKEKPGTAVRLRTVVGQAKKVLGLTVDQGIDERKPLFQLFMTRPDAAGVRDWLGWNALGPYDASRLAAESYLGWHFNTGAAKEPTRFALIQEYRDKYYQKDILTRLVAKGSLAEALKPPPPPPPPEINDALDVVKSPHGDFFVRGPKVRLQLPIRHVLADDKVHWQLDGGEPQPLDLRDSEGDLWSIPLDLPTGRHTVRVRVVRSQGAGKEPQEFVKELALRYQPPAPRLELPPHQSNAKPSSYLAVNNPSFPFKAILHTPGPAPGVKVSLRLDNEKTPRKTWNLKRSDAPQEISALLKLREGTQLIEILAQNEPALGGFEGEERDRLALQVAVNSPAPIIAIQRIEAVDGDDGPWDFNPGQKVIVDVPRVRIVGTIKTQADLGLAEWNLGVQSPRRKLALKPGEQEFTQEVELKPGEQTVHFFAKIVQGKEEGTSTVQLLYRPHLPNLVFQAPDQVVVREPDGPDETPFLVEAKLVPPSVPCPVPFKIKATLWRNQEEIRSLVLNSTAEALLPQKIFLKPGLNRLELRLDHEWGGASSEHVVDVRYVRPPRVAKVEADLDKALPFVRLRAEVHSPLKPQAALADALIVEANGLRRTYAGAVVAKATTDPTGRKWLVQVDAVPLVVAADQKIHVNQIKLSIANVDGPSDFSEPTVVSYKNPPPPLPEIALVSPRTAAVILEEPEVKLVFAIKSAPKPKTVEVSDVTQGRPVLRPAKLSAQEGDNYRYDTGTLPLQWGMNTLKIVAVNDGGSKELFLTLTVPPRPVQLSIDGIRSKGQVVKLAERDEQHPPHFPPVAEGSVVLEGKVLLNDKTSGDHPVRVYVNGYQQFPVKLGPPAPGKPLERPFKARLILNLPTNSIEVDLPTLAKELDIRKDFVVPCQKPVHGQHLNIVLLAPGLQRKDEGDLKKKVAKALDLQDLGDRNLYKSKIFELARMHLVSYVNYAQVDSLLFNIRGRLLERARAGRPNDVVMIYFLGKETVTAEGRLLWTSETRMGPRGPERVLALNDLVTRHFQDFAGAQVLFLELGSNNQVAKGPAEERRYRLALFRLVELKEPTQKLLLELAKEMPQATWLDQLRDNLVTHFQTDTFFESVPKNLKLQINPDALGK